MKTLVLLSLTALHLCCVLRISTGAILTEEMLNNQILKYIKASGKETIFIFLFVFGIRIYTSYLDGHFKYVRLVC